MNERFPLLRTLWLALAYAAGAAHAGDAGQEGGALRPVPAAASPAATSAMMLGAAWAGPRAVAVGDHGVVLLSDDQGKSFRQARAVPVSSLLTAVSFVDARQGWVVGHWGAILASSDGGENWTVQRLSTAQDRPLFAVHFFDARHGVAVGLWSLVLTTEDGGATWTERTPPPPPGARKADLNLLGLFADSKGGLYATAERGQLLHSTDRGANWQYIDTGYAGSLWTGLALPDGSLLVGGQRGTLMRAASPQGPWERVALDSRSSITALAGGPQAITLAGLDGLLAYSRNGGRSFELQPAGSGVSNTAVLQVPGQPAVLFTARGIARAAPKP